MGSLSCMLMKVSSRVRAHLDVDPDLNSWHGRWTCSFQNSETPGASISMELVKASAHFVKFSGALTRFRTILGIVSDLSLTSAW